MSTFGNDLIQAMTEAVTTIIPAYSSKSDRSGCVRLKVL